VGAHRDAAGLPRDHRPVAAAATGRSKPQICAAIDALEAAEIVVPLSASRRNRSWETAGSLGMLARLELPT